MLLGSSHRYKLVFIGGELAGGYSLYILICVHEIVAPNPIASLVNRVQESIARVRGAEIWRHSVSTNNYNFVLRVCNDTIDGLISRPAHCYGKHSVETSLICDWRGIKDLRGTFVKAN